MRFFSDIAKANTIKPVELLAWTGYFAIIRSNTESEIAYENAVHNLKQIREFSRACEKINPDWREHETISSSQHFPVAMEKTFGSAWQTQVENYKPVNGFNRSWYLYTPPQTLSENPSPETKDKTSAKTNTTTP